MDALKKLIGDLLTSKKFVATVTGVVAAPISFVITVLGLESTVTPEQSLEAAQWVTGAVTTVISAYLVSQGLADQGKEAVKIGKE